MEEQLASELLKLLEEYGRTHPQDGGGAPASLVSLAVLGGALLLRMAASYVKRRLDTLDAAVTDIQDTLDELEDGKKPARRTRKPRKGVGGQT